MARLNFAGLMASVNIIPAVPSTHSKLLANMVSYKAFVKLLNGSYTVIRGAKAVMILFNYLIMIFYYLRKVNY